jgi:hypothetical protein
MQRFPLVIDLCVCQLYINNKRGLGGDDENRGWYMVRCEGRGKKNDDGFELPRGGENCAIIQT